MKKYLLITLAFSIVMAFACKQDESSSGTTESKIVSKCAKYSVNVYKDKERTAWMANLSKTEIVDQLSTEIISNNKGAVAEVAHIRLSDGAEGYLETKHLADKTIVFTQDTKAYQRNNTGSKINATIPIGTLGFVIEEKSEWLQVFIGQIDGQWLTQTWVNEGYSTETASINDARLYDEALTVLRNKESKEADKVKAIKKLKDLQNSVLLSEKVEAYLQSLSEDDTQE